MDFNKLWQNFMDTVQNHYMDFNGRMGRAQFWYFILVCVGINIVAVIFDSIVTMAFFARLWALRCCFHGRMAARRHAGHRAQRPVGLDMGHRRRLLCAARSSDGGKRFRRARVPLLLLTIGGLIGIIYLIATIAIIYFCAQPGTPGDNQFGPPPPAWTPN